MLKINRLAHKSQLFLGLLAVSCLGLSSRVVAQDLGITQPKPLPVTTGTVQDLQGTVAKDETQWPWAISTGIGFDLDDENYEYRNKENDYVVKTDALNSVLEIPDETLSDIYRSPRPRRLPFAIF